MDNRGASLTMQYVLLVAIVALLASSLLVTVGGFVTTQQDSSVRHGLDVTSTRLVADLTAADQLAASMADTGTMELEIETPTRIAGSQYRIEVESTGTPGRSIIRLESIAPSEEATAELVTDLELVPTTVEGGRLVVVADPANDTLEVRDG